MNKKIECENNNSVSLRYYQEDAVNKTITALRTHTKVAIQMSTGTGINTVMVSVARQLVKKSNTNRVLILTAYAALKKDFIMKLDSFENNPSVIVNTIYEIGIEGFFNNYDYLLIDEFAFRKHDKYINIIKNHPSIKIIVFLNSINENIKEMLISDGYYLAFIYDLHQAVEDGFVDLKQNDRINSLRDQILREQLLSFKVLNEYIEENTSNHNLNISVDRPNILDDNQIFDLIKKRQIELSDIELLIKRKEQLSIFESKLNKTGSNLEDTEREWQNYFEKNTWIFGYGLRYIVGTSLDNRKLETILYGSDFKSSGKRVDGLLKSKGFLSTLCLVEIKTSSTSLLGEKYRKDCFTPSRELVGAITQIQNYNYTVLNKVSEKIDIEDSNGYPTGEILFNYSPKAVLIIGNLKEFDSVYGVNKSMLRSFELFRRSIQGIEIITFDELYERAKYIIG